jgi:hypothetical protein
LDVGVRGAAVILVVQQTGYVEEGTLFERRGVGRGVSIRVENGCRQLALWVAISEMALRPFQWWPPAERRGVGYGKP